MKKLFVALVSLVAGVVSADPASVHGMLIFGQQKTYVSHLPMYHSPHDYQLIMEVSLGKDEAKLKEDMLAHPKESVYTIEPKSFVLPDMVAAKKPFLAKVYRGHFERGGEVIFVATVTPTNVVFFKKLKANEKTPATLALLVFGSKDEAYVAHHITSRPNFDQVAQVSGLTAANEIQLQRNQAALPVFVAAETDKSPVTKGQVLDTFGAKLKVVKEIYLEHGDLE